MSVNHRVFLQAAKIIGSETHVQRKDGSCIAISAAQNKLWSSFNKSEEEIYFEKLFKPENNNKCYWFDDREQEVHSAYSKRQLQFERTLALLFAYEMSRDGIEL